MKAKKAVKKREGLDEEIEALRELIRAAIAKQDEAKELPEIIIADGETNGALFTNDEIRMKVRHWVSVFVADYRPLYKANVA